jgi:hypothetical protein
LRWALTPDGVVACPQFPGCSDGFQEIVERFHGEMRHARLGRGTIQALRLNDLARSVAEAVAQDPLALLCPHSYCERGVEARRRAVRNALTLPGQMDRSWIDEEPE